MAVLASDRWEVISPHLDRLLDIPHEERDAWLALLRRDDPDLADELRMLAADREALSRDGFLAGSVASPTSMSVAGHRIGAYTLVSSIGRGGMGTVWLAARSDGRFVGNVAIKLLNLGLIGRAGEERFRREGSLLARLRHPHIAQLIDAGVTDLAQPYLVLEHVEGEHIDEYCRHRALSVDARLRLFLDVLEAVAHAHANLIVHRDIKPSNVLVSTSGQVKLLDFGIAKLISRDAEMATVTLTEARPLTPAYASPEQISGEPITTATDVYSLGRLLYVLLGGSRTETRGSTVRRRLSDLDTIVGKALKRAPGERYASVTAMADDLRRYLRHEPVLARPDTVAYRTAKFLRRRARAVAVTATALVVIASIVAFYTARLSAERDRARLEAAKSSRVSELLTSLLTGADPYATHDREPTVRNILDAGAERVERELGDQPAVKAEMMTVIGRVYQRLGLHDKATPLLEQSVAIGRARPEPDVQLARSLSELGVLRRETGDVAAATPLLEESLALRQSLLGREDKDVAVSLVELGRAYEDRGADDRAEPLYREALDIRRKVLGEQHRETATSKSALALLLWRRGDLDAAESLFRQSLETSRAVLADDHPNVGSGWNNLGLVLLDKGDFIGAEPMFRRSLAIKRMHFGDKHSTLAPSLSNLAGALRQQGRYDEAHALLEEALAITRESLGDGHLSIAGLEVNLARVDLARSDPWSAEPLLRDALKRQEPVLAPTDWRLASTKAALGAALLRQGDNTAAEPLLIAAGNVLKDVPGRQGREAAETRANLATLYQARSRELRGTQSDPLSHAR